MKENDFRQEILRQARRLAFNKGSDAAALAFRGDGDETAIERLDLSAVSSIHRMANGSVEMKFIDRIKLIELLLEAGDDRPRAEGGDGFIRALDRAALRLGAESDEAKAAHDCAAGELDLARERRAVDVGGAGTGYAEYGGYEDGARGGAEGCGGAGDDGSMRRDEVG